MIVTSQRILRLLALALLARAIDNASTAINTLLSDAHAPLPDPSVLAISLGIPVFVSVLLWLLAPVLGETLDSAMKRPPPVAKLHAATVKETTAPPSAAADYRPA